MSGDDPRAAAIEAQVEEIIRKYGPYLRAVVARQCPTYMGLQIEDIEQEARMRIWRALKSEREIRNPASYIHRIAVTATIDAVRRVKARHEEQLRTTEDDQDEHGHLAIAADPSQGPDREAERTLLRAKVAAALDALGDNRRRAVQLHLEGMTTAEIGTLLGWSEAKARNLVYRGLADLRESLRAEGIDYETD